MSSEGQEAAGIQGQEMEDGAQGQNIEQEMDNLNLNLHAEEDGAEVEQGQEQGVVVVPVVDVGAAAAALQEEIVPVPPALLEPININNQEPEDQQGPPLPPVLGVQLPPPPLHPPPPPQLPLLQPLLLRRASISSLDESSQKCDENNGGNGANGGGGGGSKAGFMLETPGGAGGRPTYRNPSHPTHALESLHSMRRSRLLTDVVLTAGGVEVPAHKNMLAACSPYFYAMFTGFTEKNKERIALMDVDAEALVTLVDYVYTARVEVNEDNVQTLLQAANLLQLVDVTDACCQFLQSQLHPSNCLGIRAFADLHGCAELKEQAEKFAETHFAEVLDCDEYLALDPHQVADLIASDTITVPSEEKVYESVLAWVRHDMPRRRCHLPVLMESVRLPLLSREYLFQKVDGEALFETQPKCKDFIIEALKFHLASGDANKLASFGNSARTKPRQPIGLPRVMLAIGGQAPKAIRNVECFDFKEERWFQVTDMDTRRCRCGVAVVRGRVYAVGGFNGALRVRTVDEYDPTKDKWASVASMDARRSTLGVAVLNDKIYAVGGFDGSTGLNSAEVLDLNPSPSGMSPSWRRIASMSTRRSSVGVGVLNALVYAVGGYDGNSRHCLSSVEVYDPDRDIWLQVSDMSARRSGAGVGVLGHTLFAVGGHDGPLVRKSVECYNAETDAWKAVSDMNYCRRNAGVVTHDGLMYVVGGDDGTSNLSSVEMYNPKTDTWTLLKAAMGIGRSYTGVCVIEKPESF